MLHGSPTEIKLFLFLALPLLLAQATWIFWDARKRGEKYYWLWGIFGLMSVPGNLIIYLIVTRVIGGKKK